MHEDHEVGAGIGSALCSRLLGGARLCSPLFTTDLGGREKQQAGGAVMTILTSEGSQVRNLLRTQVRALRAGRKCP